MEGGRRRSDRYDNPHISTKTMRKMMQDFLANNLAVDYDSCSRHHLVIYLKYIYKTSSKILGVF